METLSTQTAVFPPLTFSGQLRPSQADVVAITRAKLAQGKRRLHIVAPPGSGKTVLGLYLWAECVRRPALVLSPNSAIQAQWAARTSLFEGIEASMVSTDPDQPRLLTSLTYQSLTLPGRASEDLDVQAVALWQQRLIEQTQAQDPLEAAVWLQDLQQHNPDYYEQRLSTFRKQLRDQLALGGEALQTLHQSALDTLQRLRNQGIGLIILDECHHLLGHWGRVLADAHDLLEQPVVLGLTATPPDRSGKKPEDLERYDSYFGDIDYEVPVPAVVKDGFLAPYQDLAYFVRPLQDELVYIANADDELHAIVAQLCTEQSAFDNLPAWLLRVLSEYRLPVGQQADWQTFARRDPDFADAARLFLLRRGEVLPANVPEPVTDLSADEIPEMALLVPVLDRYVRHHLRRSPNPAAQALAEQVVRRLRTLGVQITDSGSQACASPVGRVMAYSRAKTRALVPILSAE
jgi:superfamily II DNA or RNA helicase